MIDLPYSFVFGIPALFISFAVIGYFVFSHMSKKLDEEFPEDVE